MESELEVTIRNLLAPDSAVIREATIALKKQLRDPNFIKKLCEIMVSSQNAEVRQYAAMLIRRQYEKKAVNWYRLSISLRTEFKKLLIQALVNEREKSVKNSIAQLIGTIVTYELYKKKWPELIDFLQRCISSDIWETKELGISTLTSMAEIECDHYYSPLAAAVVGPIYEMLNNPQLDLKGPIACNLLKTLRYFIPTVNYDHTVGNTYPLIISRIININEVSFESNQPFVIESFELFNELLENLLHVLVPHIRALVNLCLAIGINKSAESILKIKAVSFVGWLARIKKKTLVKYKLIEPIVNMLFTVMSLPPQNDEDDDIHGDCENDILMCATQSLDLLALHLPPDILISSLLQHIESGLQSTNVYAKKASYVAIAVLAEGCAEHICAKYLETFLRCIGQGIKDPALIVSNAALYALGQFSEHLQPDISRYSCDLLPVLFDYLNQVCLYIKQTKKEPHSLSRMFYALEMFCQNLKDSILPYLPTLMERLFEMLSADMPIRVQELALSAVSAAATASNEHLLPYFDTVIAILDRYLIEISPETTSLQVQAIDTLGVVARSIGKQHFAPLVDKTIDLGMKILKNTDDPDLRKAVYGLFAAISTIKKQEMAGVLPDIVEHIIMSIRSSEGIVMHYKRDSTLLSFYDESSGSDSNAEENIEDTDNETDRESDEKIEGCSVENSYIEEKEEAIIALKEIAENTEDAFMPYLERAFEEIFSVIEYPQKDIREASIEALYQFCLNLSKIKTDEGRVALLRALSKFIPKLSELISLDEEQTVAICGMNIYGLLLSEIGSIVVEGEGHREAIMNRVKDVFDGKTKCQDDNELEDKEEDIKEQNIEGEQDMLLVESAGVVLWNLGRVVTPETFAPCFLSALRQLLKKLNYSEKLEDLSFVTGTIAECFQGLKHMSSLFIPQLLPFLMEKAEFPDDAIRNNCFYGIGELVLHGKEVVYPYYSPILQLLSTAIAKETSALARDNVVGAIARIIITNYSIIPLEQVFPVFVQQLPLKVDLQENKFVFKSILVLYQAGLPVLQPHITTLLKIAFSLLHEEKINDDETKNLVTQFIKSVHRDFPDEWNALHNEVPQEIDQICSRLFNITGN